MKRIRSGLDRRRFVQSGVGAAGALASSRQTFGQASPEASPSASPASDAPIATPVGQVDADGFYDSGDPAVPSAYTKFPKPFKATSGAPGSGGEVKALVLTYSAPPTEKGDNLYWQELEKRLNVIWTPILAPNADYGEKASTLIASGDMPDLFYINTIITNTPFTKFVGEGAFNDLTPYVTGDALAEYPNLSVFPKYMWDACTLNGKIYGVPCPTPKPGQIPAFRIDWAKKILGHNPGNAQEVHDFMVRVKDEDPDGNGSNDTWGMNIYGTYWSMGLLQNMFRVANDYAVVDGKLVPTHETEEFRQYLDYARQLFADGGYHPDALGMTWDDAVAEFSSGHTSIHTDGSDMYGPNGWIAQIRKHQPDAEVGRLIPPGHDGGKGVTYNGGGIFGYTAIPSSITDEERIKELLRILDWFSAPYGSEENTFKENGLEGEHFTFNEFGFPIRTDRMQKEEGQITAYLGGRMPVNVNPLQPEIGPLVTDEQKATYEIGIDNPVEYLYSPTAVDKGGTIWQPVDDAITDYIVGRSEWATVEEQIARWKEQGGDVIVEEYQEAYDEAQSAN